MQHNNPLTENFGGTVGGALATVAGSVFGFITVGNVIETAVMAVVGAVIGYYTNKLLKKIHK
jgi:outer membrane lipoprotein SlyB